MSPFIRKLYANQTGLPESIFSRNSDGACESCQGLGEIKTDMAFIDTLYSICKACDGTGYSARSREVRIHGLSIADIEKMTITDLCNNFPVNSHIEFLATTLDSIGLGYLTVGESLTNLSGGEAVRLKIAKDIKDLTSGTRLYALDEPTNGLHPENIDELYAFLHYIVKQNHTIVVVDHTDYGLNYCDWQIQVGPGAGRNGGKILSMNPINTMTDLET